jgi:hypothetical protein
MCETYLRNGLFVTVWAAVLDPVSRRLTYASAGHNPPRLLRGDSVLALDAAGGEWAYDRNSSFGRLNRGLDEAAKSGWIVASMKNDWKQIFF